MDEKAPHYLLVHVGGIRPKQAAHLGPEVITYFRKIVQPADAITAPLIRQPIPIQAAALLVPGSKWSATGELLYDKYFRMSDRHLFLGNLEPALLRLFELFPSNDEMPDFLKELPCDSWCATVSTENECFLIPCFELLRAFCYQAANGLSNFLFSRLPLDTLCWPLAHPTKDNNFVAHFCIASALPRSSEARVLAELLFNPDYRNCIQLAHSYLALEWHRLKSLGKPQEAHVKLRFKLGKSVRTSVYGKEFVMNGKSYFWVDELTPSDEWHSFKRAIYHPLVSHDSKPVVVSPFAAKTQSVFIDVLKGQRLKPTVPLAAEMPDSFRSFGHNIQNSEFVRRNTPPVTRSFSWADSSRRNLSSIFATSTDVENLWARPEHLLPGEMLLPENEFFHRVVSRLKLFRCSSIVVEVNNPGSQFGPGNSIFPYVCAPDSYTHLPDGRYNPVSIAHVKWGGGNFYILNVLNTQDVILCFCTDLRKWLLHEYNDFLLLVISMYFAKIHVKIKPYFSNSHYSVLRLAGSDAEDVARLCHAEMKQAIAKYNQAKDDTERMEQFFAANYSLLESFGEYYKLLAKRRAKYYPGNSLDESPINIL